MTQPLRTRSTLSKELAERIRARIMNGEFAPGARLPSEMDLGREYGISRVTVRTALRTLESQGLIDVRHGSGSYVSDFGGGIRAGLQELRSISATIREMGFEPGMEQHRAERRPATTAEAAVFDIAPGAEVLSMERMILADGQAVAFSYDLLPIEGLPEDLVAEFGSGSMFGVFDKAGITPVRAMAELHAISDESIGWGPQKPVPGLYLLLDQLHFDQRGNPVAYSRTYFVEGRFQFVVLRTR